MADANELQVWMNGERVGAWQRPRAGSHRFVYAESWVRSAHGRPLSLSLPITSTRTLTGPEVEHWFDNLLPDAEHIRRRIARRFRTGSAAAFDLLQAIGRDCVGAVQLLPTGATPDGFDRLAYDVLDGDAVERLLRRSSDDLEIEDRGDPGDLRISIAGAQEKTALLKVGSAWCRPHGATPTTHILKLPLGLVGGRRLDLSHSVANEWLCGELLRALGLPVARSEIVTFGSTTVLAVERFDRQWTDSPSPWIVRIPQEDFCQALGVHPDDKYESRGGPGIGTCVALLARSERPQADVQRFLLAQLAFWLLAATDGHAKNFSIFLQPGGPYRMTPLYDVLSLWPVVGSGAHEVRWREAKLAMAVRSKNPHWHLSRIETRHWHGLATRCDGSGRVWAAMQALVERVPIVIGQVANTLPPGFPGAMGQAIFDGMRRQAERWHAAAADIA